MKDLKQYYCEVTQDEANEAKELLVKAGEDIWDYDIAFEVYYSDEILQYLDDTWFVSDDSLMEDFTKTTYPQFKQMLIDKIKENEINA